MAQRLRADEKNSSKISHRKSISREVTDVRMESHKNISNEYDYQ